MAEMNDNVVRPKRNLQLRKIQNQYMIVEASAVNVNMSNVYSLNKTAADRFCLTVDSAAVYHNASTRFTDGGEFGLGCEMGISTQKLHARGPMGLKELTSYKYIIRGNGQTR